jgi:putative PIN family toxin of toxin-antitoxin system
MSRPKVLIDTNIVISGIIFLSGNEHIILRHAENGEIVLVLPDFVLQEAKAVLRQRFPGYEALLDIFLSNVEYITIEWSELEPFLPLCRDRITDKKDAPFLAAIIAEKPEYAITGDKGLREDLCNCKEAAKTKIYTSTQFFEELQNQ